MKTENLASNCYNMDSEIIEAQLCKFLGDVRGMKVHVYSLRPTKCPFCDTPFDLKKFKCIKHPVVRPERLRVHVTGVKNVKGGCLQIYSDLDGHPLTFINTPAFLQELHGRISIGTFDPKDFVAQDRSELLYVRFAKRYMEDMKRRSNDVPKGADGWLSPEAYREFEKYQRLYLVPYFGDLHLQDISKASIKRFLQSLKSVKTGKPASNTVKGKARDSLRHLLRWAVEEENIPPLRFEFPKIEKPRRDLYTLDEAQQSEIIKCVPEGKKEIFLFAQARPHRTNELRAIRVRDIDKRKGSYFLNGSFGQKNDYQPFLKVKSTTGAEFPLEDVSEIFTSALKNRIVGPDDFVFINPELGKPWTHNQLDGVFRRASKKAGYIRVTLEMFGRHSWVTKKMNEGWNFTEISSWSLNSVAVLQSRYANVTKATRQKVIELRRRFS